MCVRPPGPKDSPFVTLPCLGPFNVLPGLSVPPPTGSIDVEGFAGRAVSKYLDQVFAQTKFVSGLGGILGHWTVVEGVDWLNDMLGLRRVR